MKYSPIKNNVAPDSFTRAFLASMSISDLNDIHEALCYPGASHMLHFVRIKNLPFSTEDVKKTYSIYHICAELKPQFYCSLPATLIKATQPVEKLSICFKGPLHSASRNLYMLTVVDGYSRFPFSFACQNTNSLTLI